MKVRAAQGITWIVQNAKIALAIVWCTEESEEEESEVASEGENAPETSTSPRCTFAGPRGAGLFAAADGSCQQMRLLKAACRWTAYRGWRRTSYPLMSEKMCPRTYLVCTLSSNRFKQQTLALCYERSPANAPSLTFSLFSAQCHPPEVANQPDQIPAASGSLSGIQSTYSSWKFVCGLNDFGP